MINTVVLASLSQSTGSFETSGRLEGLAFLGAHPFKGSGPELRCSNHVKHPAGEITN